MAKTKKKQSSKQTSPSELLLQIRELDKLIEGNEIEISRLKAVTGSLRTARENLLTATKGTALSVAERRAVEKLMPQKPTTREMVATILSERHPDGATMAELWREISDRWSPDIHRATLSTTLIRMRESEGVSYSENKWRLKKKVR